MRKKRKKTRRRRKVPILILILIVLAALFADSNMRIVTTEYKVGNGKLPDEFTGFRVVQLSDLHAYQTAGTNEYLLSCVTEADADIIVVTGDLIDEKDQIPWARNIMTELCKIAPVYYITGNHEWACGAAKELFHIFDEVGVTTLRNSYVLIERNGESIILAGLDDPNGPADMKTPDEVVSFIREKEGDKYMLLLTHRNDWLEKYGMLDVDTAIAGHAHGGLIRLPFTDGLINTQRELFPSYTSGVYEENGTELLISRGIGNSGRTFRFLNNPHIPVAVLENN